MSDEEVLPSDSEELEELLALRRDYWNNVAGIAHQNLAVHDHGGQVNSEAGNNGLQTIPSPPRKPGTRMSRSDDEGAGGRPRKRAKLGHSRSVENVTESQSSSLKAVYGSVMSGTSGSSRSLGRDISNLSPSKSQDMTSLHLLNKQGTESSSYGEAVDNTALLLRDPTTSTGLPQARSQRCTPENLPVLLSQDPLLIGSQMLEDHVAEGLYEPRSSPSYVAPSPSPTMDPLDLFSSPLPSPPRPRKSASSRSVLPELQSSTYEQSPKAGPSRPPLRSPLPISTPGAGPSRIIRTPSPSHIFSSPLSSPEHDSTPPPERPVDGEAHLAFVEQLQEEEGRRYSLRKREARQLRPYEWDMRLYKRTMKGASPDAIIKSIPHRRRSRSPGDIVPDSDPDVDPSLLERAESDDDRPRRQRRTKSVSDDDEPLRRRPPRSRTVSHASHALPEKSPAKWIPKAMQINFDSSGDEMSAPDPKGKKPQGKKPHKRAFPIRMKRKSRSRSRHRSREPNIPPDNHELQSVGDDGTFAREPSHIRSSSPFNYDEPTDWELPPPFPISPLLRNTSPPIEPPTSSHVSSTGYIDIYDDDDDMAQPYPDDLSLRAQSPPSLPRVHSGSPEIRATVSSGRRAISISDDDPESRESAEEASGLEDSSDSDPEAGVDPDQWRALIKTMPVILARRLVKEDAARRARNRRQQRQQSYDGPIQPGQARRKKSFKHRNREIRGDEESSDVEMLEDRSASSSSPPPPFWKSAPRSPSPERIARRYTDHIPDTIVISSSDEDEDEDMPDERDDIREILRDEDDEIVREAPLVNYMRPRGDGGAGSSRMRTKSSRSRPRGVGGGGGGGGTGSGKRRRIHIAAGGSSSQDRLRQTLLHFPPVKLPGKSSSSTTTQPTKRTKRLKSRATPRAGPHRRGLHTKVVPKPKVDPDSVPSSNPKIDIRVGMPQITTESKKPAWKKDRNRTRDRVYFAGSKNPSTLQSGNGSRAYTTTIIEWDAPERQSIKLVRRVLDARPVRRKGKGVDRSGVRSRHAFAEGVEDFPTMDIDHPAARAGSVKRRHLSNIYLDISKLPSGIAFARGTYLGDGYLHAMFTAHADKPGPAYIGEKVMTDSLSVEEFRNAVDKELTGLLASVSESPNSIGEDVCTAWRGHLHSLRRWSRWHLGTAAGDELQELRAALERHIKAIRDLVHGQFAVRSDDAPVNLLILDLQWTSLELLHYMRPKDGDAGAEEYTATVLEHIKLLMQHLWSFNKKLAGELYRLSPSEPMDYSHHRHRIAELWICLIHLTLHNAESGLTQLTFWDLLSDVIDKLGLQKLYGKQTIASEALWMAIYGLYGLSQFSLHGFSTSKPHLPPCWKFVAWALKKVNVASELNPDDRVSEDALKRRDKYFKVLVGRCVALCERWGWSLDNSFPMFEQLAQRFKARRFGNLRGEKADFPSFMLHHDLAKLHQDHSGTDTAFQLFLKLVVRAASTTDEQGQPRLAQPIPPIARKILSLVVPFGSIPFTKSAPASTQELSMLYNRLAAVAVAIYINPADAKNRLSQASNYVDFKNTNWPTRRVCVEGWMHLAVLLRHFDLPLDPALKWLGDMASCVASEAATLDETAVANHPATAMQILLLERVLDVLETPRMDREEVEPKYPEPALLDGPWIPLSSSRFLSVPKVRNKMRLLIEAFLKARSRFFPNAPRPQILPAAKEESQESQDLWGEFDDIAYEAFGEEGANTVVDKQREEMDRTFAELMNKSLFPSIHTQVMRQCRAINSARQDPRAADRWLEYIVNAALVMVRNKLKEWKWVIDTGPKPWRFDVSEADTQRKLHLKFMLTILQVDPPAYADHQDVFLDFFLECIALPLSHDKPTYVPDYASAVFTLDGLRHPLLMGIPCEPIDASGLYKLSLDEFLNGRLSYLERILFNMNQGLVNHLDSSLQDFTSKTPSRLKILLTSVQEAHVDLSPQDKAMHTPFCLELARLLAQHRMLDQNPIVKAYLQWTTRI